MKLLASGEEGKVYKVEDGLIKIFNNERRENIINIDENIYKKLSLIKTNRFYLPTSLIYENNKFIGIKMNEFKEFGKITDARSIEINEIIKELKLIEEDIKTLSDNGILIRDMKIGHILFNMLDSKIGIIDCGLYEESCDKNLYLNNLIYMNYYLRQALLWVDNNITYHEMCGYDFPYIYDDLDHSMAYLSDILKVEANIYDVSTIEELRNVYKYKKF